jgi:hypothetical protein
VGNSLKNVQVTRTGLLADKLDDEAVEASIHDHELHHQAGLLVGGRRNTGGHNSAANLCSLTALRKSRHAKKSPDESGLFLFA